MSTRPPEPVPGGAVSGSSERVPGRRSTPVKDPTEGYHAALASPSRRQVLDALVASREPLDATTVADRLGVHVSTARFHLDRLADAGLADRRSVAEKRRGRPRMLYSPAGIPRDEGAREQLIGVLAAALADEPDPAARAVRAGRSWAKGYTLDPDDPVAGLVGVLDRLGFDAEPDVQAATIRLRACPFRDAARAHPEVVCSVHRGLIDRLLEATSTDARLVPFAEPQLCLVTLGGAR